MIISNFPPIYINTRRERKYSLVPFFIPFFGCPQICVFCNQSLQTGTNNDFTSKSSEKILTQLEETYQHLLEKKNRNQSSELAFYGGTFSALPEKEFQLCLDFVEKCKNESLIAKARISTRPDACKDDRLNQMKGKGIDTIELGIQTFFDKALFASNRNYTSNIAEEACKKVKSYGFELGIQLLPNLPSQERNDFLNDIKKSISLEPNFMRFYPCLVVEGTKLAAMWKENIHTVWNQSVIIELLAQALYQTWQARIPVIRIGVAYEEDFYKKVLAGVQDLSLGQKVQERAAQIAIENIIQEYNLDKKINYTWTFPLAAKGYLSFKNNKDFWADKGIVKGKIFWHDEDSIIIKARDYIL